MRLPDSAMGGRSGCQVSRMLPATLLAFLAPIRILLVGDSTVTDSAGWGAGLQAAFRQEAAVINHAKGGRSSKSYRDEGHWDKARTEKADYVLIQFGHNDNPGKGPARETDPETTFRENLSRYLDEARAAGMKPVLVTPLVRRVFGPDGRLRKPDPLAPYAQAVRKLAADRGVPCIDLYGLSGRQAEDWGPERSLTLGPSPEGKGPDRTHLNAHGSRLAGEMVANELARLEPALSPYLNSMEAK